MNYRVGTETGENIRSIKNTAILTALTTGTVNAGGNIRANSSLTNQTIHLTNTSAEAEYDPYVEQLKQAQRDRKVRDLQNAYQKFLQSESGANQQYTQEEPLINSVNSKDNKQTPVGV